MKCGLLSPYALSILMILLCKPSYSFNDGRPCLGTTGKIINMTTHTAFIKQRRKLFNLFKELPATIPPGKTLNLSLINDQDKWNFLLGPFAGIPAIYTINLDAELMDKNKTQLLLRATFRFPGCVIGMLQTETGTHFRVEESTDGRHFRFTIIDKIHIIRKLSWYQRFYEWLFD